MTLTAKRHLWVGELYLFRIRHIDGAIAELIFSVIRSYVANNAVLNHVLATKAHGIQCALKHFLN